MNSWKYILAAWLLCTAIILPVMVVLTKVEKDVAEFYPSTFKIRAGEALKNGEYSTAETLCSGALATVLYSDRDTGQALILRAKARVGLNNLPRALSDLEQCASIWSRQPWLLAESDRSEIEATAIDLATKLIRRGRKDDALRALSAAGRGTGDYVEYLYALTDTLDAEMQNAIWPSRPSLYVEDFESREPRALESPGALESRTDDTTARSGARSGHIRFSSDKEPSRIQLAIPTRITLWDKPFFLRLYLKEEASADPRLRLVYWSELAQKAITLAAGPPLEAENDWKAFEVLVDTNDPAWPQDLRETIEFGDWAIVRLLIESGGTSKALWVDDIEILLPSGA